MGQLTTAGFARRITIVSIASLAALGASSVLPATAKVPAPATAPSWRVAKSFGHPGLALFGGIVAFKDGSAWVAGESTIEAPVLYHLQGGKWSRVILLGPPGSFATELSASSPTNVWAALANEPAVAHLTSAGWQIHNFTQGSLQVIVASVQTFGPRNTWVFYTGLSATIHHGYAAHFDGTNWHVMRLPSSVTGNTEVGMTSASSPTNIWTLSLTSDLAEPMHYDGHSWKFVRLPKDIVPAGQQIFMRQVLAKSPTNVWITALSAGKTKAGPLLLLHWNGTKWSKETKSLPTGTLDGPIADDGHGGLWLVRDSSKLKQDLLHFLHGKWTATHLPASSVKGSQLSVGFLTRIPGTKAGVLGDALISSKTLSQAGSAIIKFSS